MSGLFGRNSSSSSGVEDQQLDGVAGQEKFPSPLPEDLEYTLAVEIVLKETYLMEVGGSHGCCGVTTYSFLLRSTTGQLFNLGGMCPEGCPELALLQPSDKFVLKLKRSKESKDPSTDGFQGVDVNWEALLAARAEHEKGS